MCSLKKTYKKNGYYVILILLLFLFACIFFLFDKKGLVEHAKGFPENVAKSMAYSILTTVNNIHSQEIAHRDIKLGMTMYCFMCVCVCVVSVCVSV